MDNIHGHGGQPEFDLVCNQPIDEHIDNDHVDNTTLTRNQQIVEVCQAALGSCCNDGGGGDSSAGCEVAQCSGDAALSVVFNCLILLQLCLQLGDFVFIIIEFDIPLYLMNVQVELVYFLVLFAIIVLAVVIIEIILMNFYALSPMFGFIWLNETEARRVKLFVTFVNFVNSTLFHLVSWVFFNVIFGSIYDVSKFILDIVSIILTIIIMNKVLYAEYISKRREKTSMLYCCWDACFSFFVMLHIGLFSIYHDMYKNVPTQLGRLLVLLTVYPLVIGTLTMLVISEYGSFHNYTTYTPLNSTYVYYNQTYENYETVAHYYVDSVHVAWFMILPVCLIIYFSLILNQMKIHINCIMEEIMTKENQDTVTSKGDDYLLLDNNN